MVASSWMDRGCVCWVGVAAALVATTARAAPIEFVEQRDSYMIFRDVDQSVEYADWFYRDPFLAGYAAVEDGFLAEHPDDSQFLVMYTTWQLPPPVGALYQSVSNDIHGIGYEHIAPEDAVIPDEGMGYFDDTPNSQVTGFMHMNQWTQYLGGDPGGVNDNIISLIFGQELGHAWLAFVYYQQDGVGDWRTDMLGRSNAHWSFYMNTGGSPVQGHEWNDNGDGTFTAVKQDIYEYSDLDLYLMGLLPADMVAPWFVLDDPSNCVDSALPDGSCAEPDGFLFEADSYTVNATRRDITIDDVIAVEGPRMPAFGEAPDSYDVSFILVTRADEVLDENQKLLVDAIIDRSIEIFDAQTRGYAHVVNRTAQGGGSDESGGSDDDTSASADDSGSASDPSDSDGQGESSADGSASASASGGASASASGSADGSAEGSGDSDGGAGAEQDSGGCGCASGRSPSVGGLGLLGFGLLGLLRRRRRTPARLRA
jgi:MYXO-CTERM domain-containing protein